MSDLAPRAKLVACAALFAAAFLAFSFLFLALPEIADADSYFHLGMARQYAAHPLLDDLPWARLSILRDGYGDKELLFHWILAPFAAAGEGEETGRIALAFFNALLVAAVAWLGMEAIGTAGLAAPLVLYVGSAAFWGRVARLRPEILALLLFLAIVRAAAGRRRLLLFVACFLFALSYTAVHVAVGFCVLFALVDRDWQLLPPSAGGAALGLLLHPQMPKNLTVWWYQNVLFFLHRSEVEVGPEIQPPQLAAVLLHNAALFAIVAMAWLTARRAESESGDGRTARCFAIAAAVFGLLYAFMTRMAIYFAPMLLLAVLFEMRRRGLRPSRAAALSLALLPLTLLDAGSLLRAAGSFGAPHAREAEYAALGRAIPNGARVATDWQHGEAYVFFAPQGRYLNVLEPLFMALPYPREYRLQERLWAGEVADPAAAVRALDSDYVVFHRSSSPRLFERIEGDPRFRILFAGDGVLAAVHPPPPGTFVTDWSVDGRPYPRATSRRIGEVEAYVDLTRLPRTTPCTTATTTLTAPAAATIELAPWGPAALSVDGHVLASTRAELRAVPGRGLTLPLPPTPVTHRLAVLTCESEPNGPRGFYLRITPTRSAS